MVMGGMGGVVGRSDWFEMDGWLGLYCFFCSFLISNR